MQISAGALAAALKRVVDSDDEEEGHDADWDDDGADMFEAGQEVRTRMDVQLCIALMVCAGMFDAGQEVRMHGCAWHGVSAQRRSFFL